MSAKIELLIDHRERELKTFFANYSNVKFSNLDIGDIVFRYQGDIVVLIERKTIGDLISSIKDGRYREQKMRLLKYREDNPHIKILYILEGHYKKSASKYLAYKTFLSCLRTFILDEYFLYLLYSSPIFLAR